MQEILERRFQRPLLGSPPRAYRQFVAELPAGGIAGGAAYDALVAASAAKAGATLATGDRRALSTYEKYGVAVRWVP